MSNGLKKEDEIVYLNETLKVIDTLLASFGVSSDRQSKDIKDDRRFFWNNFSELDDIEIQQLNQDMALQEKLYIKNKDKINTLRTQKEVPYFARIDFKEDGDSYDESLYIGIASVVKDDYDFLVLDWRSPIANMFYDFEIGRAFYETPNGQIDGEIVLNRQFNIKNGEIKFIHESGSNIQDDSLLEILSSNTSDKMKNIVSSIQKKQNEIIRSEKAKILLLQGCAGSGKTSIAMHRAAYLLYKHRKTLRADNILIFSPNDVFSDYIADVLPGLGEQNIKQTTFESFYKGYLPSVYQYEKKHDYLEFIYSHNTSKHFDLRTSGMKYKNTLEFGQIITKFCDTLPEILPVFKDITLGGQVIIRKNKVKETFITRFASVPYITRIDNLKQSLVSQVETKYYQQAKKKNASDFGYNYIDHGDNFDDYIVTAVSELVDSMFKIISPVEIYKRLWLDINKFTKDKVSEISMATIASLNDLLVPFEDIVPILYIRCYMEGFRDYNNIKHIIIDECQDYSPLFYTIINKTFKNSSATILGDLNQRISSDTNITAKEEIANVFGFDNTEIECLTKSYRSTKNITNFAKEILRSSEAVEAVDRDGLDVSMIKSDDINGEIIKLIDAMKNRDLTSIAVITKTAAKSQDLYDNLKDKIDGLNLIIDENSLYSRGITIIPSYISKGLEFDGVIIPDCDDSYALEVERNLLYTVCTRALHELHLITNKEFSPLI